jgi:hypothetical protein
MGSQTKTQIDSLVKKQSHDFQTGNNIREELKVHKTDLSLMMINIKMK